MTRFTTAATAALLLLSVGRAHATVVSGTFTGTIDGNTRDTYGLFGATDANLSGETFTATYRYDTSLTFMYMSQSTFDAYLGTGCLTLSVTIGANTVATTGITNAQIVDTQDGLMTEVTLTEFAPAPLIDFTLFVQGAWVPGVTINAPFLLAQSDYGQKILVSADGSHYDELDFVGSSDPLTPAPEPDSLAVICAGLAGIGCVRRHRQSTASLARSRVG